LKRPEMRDHGGPVLRFFAMPCESRSISAWFTAACETPRRLAKSASMRRSPGRSSPEKMAWRMARQTSWAREGGEISWRLERAKAPGAQAMASNMINACHFSDKRILILVLGLFWPVGRGAAWDERRRRPSCEGPWRTPPKTSLVLESFRFPAPAGSICLGCEGVMAPGWWFSRRKP
jgi:hypothetical protein